VASDCHDRAAGKIRTNEDHLPGASRSRTGGCGTPGRSNRVESEKQWSCRDVISTRWFCPNGISLRTILCERDCRLRIRIFTAGGENETTALFFINETQIQDSSRLLTGTMAAMVLTMPVHRSGDWWRRWRIHVRFPFTGRWASRFLVLVVIRYANRRRNPTPPFPEGWPCGQRQVVIGLGNGFLVRQ